jgi:hypothetical protein
MGLAVLGSTGGPIKQHSQLDFFPFGPGEAAGVASR